MKKAFTLSQDTRPQEQPEGTIPFGKNGIVDYLKNSTTNEPGFLPSSAVIPYTPIGILETDVYPVVFSTDNTNSAWGFYNYDEDTYQPIFNDSLLDWKVGLSTEHPVTGTVQRNYKGELVGAVTDGQPGHAFYLNFDNPEDPQDITDLHLFPTAVAPQLDIEVQSGGNLEPGAYYVAVKYEKNDGTKTSFLTVSAPKIIAPTGTSAITDKGLEIHISQADQNYEKIILAIISRKNGILSAVQLLQPYNITGSGVIFYSGSEFTEPIGMEEILVPMARYESVGSFGQLNDSLYAGDLRSPKKLNMQPYVNLIRLRWHSELITVDPVNTEHAAGEKKSFLHQEVLCAYIRFKLTGGSVTDSFPIPGPALTAADRAPSVTGATEGLEGLKFQLEDTIPQFDRSRKSGYFGKWENATELYPDTEDFDSTSVGGEDLRGQPVRHHRLPSIRWCKQNLYSTDIDYGRNKLDLLGISVENVVIPQQYQDQIVGWEVFYAKRTVGNSTVISQSLALFGARNKYEPQYGPSTYYSTGGNWDSDIRYGRTERMRLFVDQSILRFHGVDLLLSKPSLPEQGTYMDMQLKLSRRDIPATGGYMEDGSIGEGQDAPIVFKLDYIQRGTPPVLPAKSVKKLTDLSYVPNHVRLGKWDNIGLETCVGARIHNPEQLISVPSWLQVSPNSVNKGVTGNGYATQVEETFLTNLMALKQELYVPYTGQALVRAGQSQQINTTEIFFGGDTYICDYSFHTYGQWVSNMGNTKEELYKGTKTVRRFLCEAAANLYTRFEDPTNSYSRYYPKSPLTQNPPNHEANYLTMFYRDQEPNQFGYTRDSNAQDDLIVSSIFNPYNEQITEHYYRIHRGGKLDRQSKIRSWRTFLPLDYYEMQKNMGRITHIEGMDDHLLIHMENALFYTQDKSRLESDLISVTLGAGDIFQFEPQEGLSSKLGYAGNQHKLATIRTPFGYVFIDSREGQIFLYKGQLKLLNGLLQNFFQAFLRLKETNVFIGNGYTIGYDSRYKRLLITAKNRSLPGSVQAPIYHPDMLATLQAGDLVYKNGRLQRFLGLNVLANSGLDCSADLIPVMNDIVFTIPEDLALQSLVGILQGQNVDNFYLDGNSAPFQLTTQGQLKLVGALDYFTKNQYVFTGRAVNSNGNMDAFTLTINIIQSNRAPQVQDAEVTIQDVIANATVIHTMSATDRENDELIFSIASGNTDNVFALNTTTGALTIADNTKLNGITLPRYELSIAVADGVHTVLARVIVNVVRVNQPPVVNDYTVSIEDTAPTNTIVFVVPEAQDVEQDPLTYLLSAESVSGIFGFDPDTRTIKLNDATAMVSSGITQFTLTITAHDNQPTHDPQVFTVTINVVVGRPNIIITPTGQSCANSAGCPAGWTLNAEGTACIRVLTTPPTITQSTCLVASTDSVYGEFGARIYKPGFNNASIALDAPGATEVEAEMATAYWIGVANQIGVWVDTDCDGTRDALAAGVQATILYNYNNQGAARTVYAGVFGDNEFILKHNGVDIAATTDNQSDRNFKRLHIFPINLLTGQNIFNVVATGDGSVNDAVGLIVYDNTVATIQAAAADVDLNILFSSSSLRGTNSSVATCPAGYALDEENGNLVCKMIESQPAGNVPTASWSSVQVTHRITSAVLGTYPNDATEKYFQDILLGYYQPVNDATVCGGTQNLYYNTQQQAMAQKLDCAEGVGSIVTYVIPEGLIRSLTSQAHADQLALGMAVQGAQQYANLKGNCL